MLKHGLTAVALMLAMSATAAHAHEVNASSVSVAVEGDRLEILHTTPIGTAEMIAASLSDAGRNAPAEADMLNALASGWGVAAGDAPCELSRLAHRSVHHGHEIQIRALYHCPDGKAPSQIAAPWLMHTSEDHFLMLTLSHEGRSKTVIFQRQPLVIDVSAFEE